MTSPNYTADPTEIDNGGVHTNSGVNNKAAFLITDGGTLQRPHGHRPRHRQGGAHLLRGRRPRCSPRAATTPTSAARCRRPCTNLVGDRPGITAANCTEVARRGRGGRDEHRPARRAARPQAPAAACPAAWCRTDLFSRRHRERRPVATGRQRRRSPAARAYPERIRPTRTSGTEQPLRATTLRPRSATLLDRMTSSVAIPAGRELRLSCASTTPTGSRTTRRASALRRRRARVQHERRRAARPTSEPLLTDVGYNGTIAIGARQPARGPSRRSSQREQRLPRRAGPTLTSLDGPERPLPLPHRRRLTRCGGARLVHRRRPASTRAPPPVPPDGDGDGVPDASDACPAARGGRPRTACPAPANPGGWRHDPAAARRAAVARPAGAATTRRPRSR